MDDRDYPQERLKVKFWYRRLGIISFFSFAIKIILSHYYTSPPQSRLPFTKNSQPSTVPSTNYIPQSLLTNGRDPFPYRYRVFRENLAEIVRLNDAQDSYRVGVNFLADLTPAEQSLYQGLNATDHDGLGDVVTGAVDPVLPVNTTEVNWSER